MVRGGKVARAPSETLAISNRAGQFRRMKLVHSSLASLFLLAAPAAAEEPVQWETLEGLSPAEIGDLVLEGRDHRQIVEVEERSHSMNPPGMRELLMRDLPRRTAEGCVRTRWQATFWVGTSTDPMKTGLWRLLGGYEEISLGERTPCILADYTSLGTGVDVATGLAGLKVLAQIGAGERELECVDQTEGNVCRTPRMMRDAIRYASAWHVRREGSAMEFWLGIRGMGPVTEVSVPDDPLAKVQIERAYPPPF